MNKAGNFFYYFLIVLMLSAFLPLSSAKTSESYFHSNDYYVVSFDGEGDAIVSAKLVIDNFTDKRISNIDLELPGTAKLFKAVLEPYYSPYYGGYVLPEPNLENSDIAPEYRNEWNAEKIDFSYDFTSTATILHLTLPHSIEPNSKAAVVLLYKVSRYAEKDLLGTSSFDFKTIIDKKASLIQNVRVAVNVQEGLFLKGGTSNVEYKPDFFGSAAVSKMSSAEVSSSYYRDYSSAIEYSQGAIVKNAFNLDPFESFHVKGQYSENWLLLFLGDIILWIIILGIIGLIAKKILFPHSEERKEIFDEPKFREKGKDKLIQKPVQSIQLNGNNGSNSGLIVGTGFFSALAIIGYWWFFALIMPMLGWSNYSLTGLLVLMFFLLGIALTLLLLIAPPIYFGKKKGFSTGLWIAISSILWLFALAIISLIIIALLTPSYAYPMPVMVD